MAINLRASLLAVLLGGGLTACGHSIHPGELGLRYRSFRKPALQPRELTEGFYFQWWWNNIVSYDVTWQSVDIDMEVLTADDLHVPVTLTVTFRPQPGHLRDLHTTVGPRYYNEIIEPAVVALARDEFAQVEHNKLARESLSIEGKLLAAAQARVAGKPVEIDSIAVKHIQFDKDVTGSISQKLVMEQQAEQKDFEILVAQKDAEIARTAAKGQGDAARILAEGEGAAIVIRGKAQAQAQDAIGDTLTKRYLQFKAFDGDNTRYYFAPIGKDGLPIIIQP
ncbi:MAG: hypothetical protein GXP62_04555 [Oligoflexia bacterium]|nr:hypothetical protein [Oligoflexia bacterium]